MPKRNTLNTIGNWFFIVKLIYTCALLHAEKSLLGTLFGMLSTSREVDYQTSRRRPKHQIKITITLCDWCSRLLKRSSGGKEGGDCGTHKHTEWWTWMMIITPLDWLRSIMGSPPKICNRKHASVVLLYSALVRHIHHYLSTMYTLYPKTS